MKKDKEELDFKALQKELLEKEDKKKPKVKIKEKIEKPSKIKSFIKEKIKGKEPDNLTKSTYKEKDFIKKDRWNDIKGIIREQKDKYMPNRSLLINMELRNGHKTSFVVFVRKNSFEYDGGYYIIDDDFKYFHIASKLWALDYHQDLSFPINKKIDVNTIKKAVNLEGISEVDTAINPMTLKQFIESEVIQKVLKGAEMDSVFKFLKIMSILILCVSILTLLIIVQTTGVLNNMHIPFIS